MKWHRRLALRPMAVVMAFTVIATAAAADVTALMAAEMVLHGCYMALKVIACTMVFHV